MATLYFSSDASGTYDYDYSNPLNWFTNNSLTIPAGSTPAATDDVVVLGEIGGDSSGIASSTGVANVSAYANTAGFTFLVFKNFSFYGGAGNANYNIGGNCYFYDCGYVNTTFTVNGNVYAYGGYYDSTFIVGGTAYFYNGSDGGGFITGNCEFYNSTWHQSIYGNVIVHYPTPFVPFPSYVSGTITYAGLISYSGIFPYTLTFDPKNAIPTSTLYKIIYDFGDGTVVTDNGTLQKNNSLYFKPQTHTYYEARNFIGSISFYQIGNPTPTVFPLSIDLVSPKMEGSSGGFFDELHLLGTRMFGPSNDILYMFESINPNYVIPTVVNWQEKPIESIPTLMAGSYRPYRLLQPFEKSDISDINIGTDLKELSQVAATYNPDYANLFANKLVAYWKLDNNGSGGVSLLDYSGNGYNLTATNTPTLTSGIDGSGSSAYLNPSNRSYLSSSTIPISGDWSVSFWFNKRSTNQTGSYSAYYSLGTVAGVKTYYISGGVKDTNNWINTNGSDYWQSFVPTSSAWHHSVLVSNSSGLIFYLDGSEYRTASTTINRSFTGLAIGVNTSIGSGSIGDNYIDEFSVWNRALSNTEVSYLYNNGKGI